LLALALCLAAILPFSVSAQTYRVEGTDLSITVDDTVWYVFTRDNIANNPELDELGLTYEYMDSSFRENEAYLDAILFYDSGEFLELLGRKTVWETEVVNMSNYPYDEVLDAAELLAEKQGVETYSVYENRYKFIYLEFFDDSANYYINTYFTVVNGEGYSFVFQAPAPFTDWEYEEMERIIDSIEFDVDPNLKEPKKDSFLDNVLSKTVAGAITGGIAGGIIAVTNKKKKKKAEAEAFTSSRKGPDLD